MDYVPENPEQFKIGHDKIVKKFKDDLIGRVIGFGTYDLHRPDNRYTLGGCFRKKS